MPPNLPELFPEIGDRFVSQERNRLFIAIDRRLHIVLRTSQIVSLPNFWVLPVLRFGSPLSSEMHIDWADIIIYFFMKMFLVKEKRSELYCRASYGLN